MHRSLVLAILLLATAGAMAASNPQMRIAAMPAKGEIRLDGDLNDPGWREATTLPPFVYRGSQRSYRLRTLAKLAYDDENLYVALAAYRPEAEKLKYRDQKSKDESERAGHAAYFLKSTFGTSRAAASPISKYSAFSNLN